MPDTADKLLLAIRALYRKWLEGSLSQEDALFEIGDLLAQAPDSAERRPRRSAARD